MRNGGQVHEPDSRFPSCTVSFYTIVFIAFGGPRATVPRGGGEHMPGRGASATVSEVHA
jgi:hypothetical protein